MIIIADAGPLLHLFWVDALTWALPLQNVAVVDAVRREVERHAPGALQETRLQFVTAPATSPQSLADWMLDEGEDEALRYALAQPVGEDVLILSDDTRARQACYALSIPVIGSLGLIVAAVRAGQVSRDISIAALRDLPGRGKLHVRAGLLAAVIAEVEESADRIE